MINNKNKSNPKNISKPKKKHTPHDGLIKKVMENPIAAQEFLDEYVRHEATHVKSVNSG